MLNYEIINLGNTRNKRVKTNKIYYYDLLESTQTLAISLAEENIHLNEGKVIASKSQTRGRGRNNRQWISPEGGLWFSIIIKPKFSHDLSSFLPLISALSICNSINKISNVHATIKWPNDILINKKKVSGILIDSNLFHDVIDKNNNKNSLKEKYYSVIGIGINLNVETKNIISNLSNEYNNKPFQEISSLKNEVDNVIQSKKEELFNIKKLLKSILQDFEDLLLQLESNDTNLINNILISYKQLCETVGKNVCCYHNNKLLFCGHVKDIDNDGSLLIQKENEISVINLYSGDLSIRYKND
ncbi:MAG: biotin--[acetyl-CoA-carboxylase] ligase [Nitrososphaeraceae archaeon]